MAARVSKIKIADLPSDMRAFLREVAKRGAAHPVGLYFPRTRAWTVVGAVLGLCMVGAPLVWYLGRNPYYAPAMPDWWLWVVVVLGTLLLGASLDTLLRVERSPDALGRFEFVGARGWWIVGPHQVEVRNLQGLTSLRLVHHYTNGAYQHTAMHLELPGGVRTWNVSPKAKAEKIGHYLSVLTHLTGRSEPALRAAVLADAELLGRLARQVVDGVRDVRMPASTGLAEPAVRELRSTRDSLRLGILAASALVGLALCGAILPAAWSFVRDGALYADVLEAAEGDPGPAEYYLSELPHGRHADEARVARDDQRFAQARIEAERDHRPTSLRAYLVDDENQRHRDEALRLVAGFYDQARTRVRALRTPLADGELVDGLLAVLTALERADTPVVGVAFSGTHQPEPADEEELLVERIGESWYAASDPKIKEMQEQDPDGSAIIDLGGTFDEAQVQAREAVILARLQAALDEVLGLDLLALRPAAEGEPPVFEIAYRTYPSGDVYIYSRETTEYPAYGLPSLGGHTTTATMGLLRGYAIAWTVGIAPPGGRPIQRELGSLPADSLRMDDGELAPAWAPYAVILYSAFHDFSSELIRLFGLTPPPSPNVFSFADATGTRQDLDAPTGGPGDPLGGAFDPERLEQMLQALEGLEGLQFPERPEDPPPGG